MGIKQSKPSPPTWGHGQIELCKGNSNFTNAILLLRAIYDLSIEEFADYCGVSAETIKRYEKGTMQPKTQTICKLCEAFKISPETFANIMIQTDHIPAYNLYIILKPGLASDTITDPNYSVGRVLFLLRILKEVHYYMVAYGCINHQIYSPLIGQVRIEDLDLIEQLKRMPSFETQHFLCEAYKTTVEKVWQYASNTDSMTWTEAAMFIANELYSSENT